jgi:HK97 family phage prohead protease
MNELIHLRAGFIEKSVNEEDESLIIKGYASTINKDRVGDVIEKTAWTKGGLANYLKNPVVLAYHDHKRPIGKVIEYSVDEVGLKVTAKISKAAGDVVSLIKDGVLQAFSVGVKVKDADYDSERDIFLIKDVELHEVSVVAVPANQDSLFSVSKCFNSDTDFAEFKQKFAKNPESGAPTVVPELIKEEFIMDPTELENLISKALNSELTRQKAEQDALKKAEEAEAARKQELVTIAKSGAEALVDDLRKSMKQSEETFAAKLAELQGEIINKSDEIAKITRDRSKVEFADRVQVSNSVSKDGIQAALLAKALAKDISDTRFGREILEKAVNDSSSFRVASDKWEQELANNLEQEIQLQLRVGSLFREVQINARSQVVTVNPDMYDLANWVTSAETHGPGDVDLQGNTSATQVAAAHRTGATTDPEVWKNLQEITLTAPKMAAKSYLTDETEEDAIIPILPLIQEGLVRAHARKVERSLLLDVTGTNGALVTGLIQRAVTLGNNVEGPIAATTKLTGAHIVAARRKLGKYGIDLQDLRCIVSVDAWYDLLEDPAFADFNELGSQAIKITGQVGSMYGLPVIVSPELAAKANGAVGIVLVNTRNYLMPRRRGVTVQSDYDVEKQRRVLVATQRWGFSSIISAAPSVATVRYDDNGTA